MALLTDTGYSSTGVSTVLAAPIAWRFGFCLYSGHILFAEPTLTYPLF